jgi:hypothetical protein
MWFFSGSDWLLKNNFAWLKWSKKLGLLSLILYASILSGKLVNPPCFIPAWKGQPLAILLGLWAVLPLLIVWRICPSRWLL